MRNRRKTPIEERYWAKVTKGGPFDCWGWAGATAPGGYGTLGLGGRRAGSIRAHRLSWEIQYGPIPDGMIVMHICDNPPCSNPFHLMLGTKWENSRDMVMKKRHRTAPKLGDDNAASKLTGEQVLEIRTYPRKRGSIKFLAAKFGMSVHAISNIVNGYTWRHLNSTGERHPAQASLPIMAANQKEKTDD